MDIQEYLNEHIEECRNRVKTIQNYIESNDAIDLDDCRKNIAVLQAVIVALQEKQHYDDLQKRLHDIFDGDVTLDFMVDELQRQIEEPGKPHPVYAKILTYEDAEKWDRWKHLDEKGRLIELHSGSKGKVYAMDKTGGVVEITEIPNKEGEKKA